MSGAEWQTYVGELCINLLTNKGDHDIIHIFFILFFERQMEAVSMACLSASYILMRIFFFFGNLLLITDKQLRYVWSLQSDNPQIRIG